MWVGGTGCYRVPLYFCEREGWEVIRLINLIFVGISLNVHKITISNFLFLISF